MAVITTEDVGWQQLTTLCGVWLNCPGAAPYTPYYQPTSSQKPLQLMGKWQQPQPTSIINPLYFTEAFCICNATLENKLVFLELPFAGRGEPESSTWDLGPFIIKLKSIGTTQIYLNVIPSPAVSLQRHCLSVPHWMAFHVSIPMKSDSQFAVAPLCFVCPAAPIPSPGIQSQLGMLLSCWKEKQSWRTTVVINWNNSLGSAGWKNVIMRPFAIQRQLPGLIALFITHRALQTQPLINPWDTSGSPASTHCCTDMSGAQRRNKCQRENWSQRCSMPAPFLHHQCHYPAVQGEKHCKEYLHPTCTVARTLCINRTGNFALPSTAGGLTHREQAAPVLPVSKGWLFLQSCCVKILPFMGKPRQKKQGARFECAGLGWSYPSVAYIGSWWHSFIKNCVNKFRTCC